MQGKTRGFAREILIRRGVETDKEARQEGAFVDRQTGISLVAIPAGEFQMGSREITDEEKPVHTVHMTQDFWLGKYPVTNAQYRRFMKSAGKRVNKPAYWDDRRFNQPKQPVVGVSWDEAGAFCEWAGGRLPSDRTRSWPYPSWPKAILPRRKVQPPIAPSQILHQTQIAATPIAEAVSTRMTALRTISQNRRRP